MLKGHPTTWAYKKSVAQAVNDMKGGAANPAIEEFIIINGLDEKAATILRESDPDLQMEVLTKGNIEGVSNASSVVMWRIGEARRAKIKSQAKPPPVTKEAMCPRFLEMGKCKYGQACYYAHGQAEIGASNSHIQGAAIQGAEFPVSNIKVEEFVLMNELDDKVAQILRESDPSIQSEVLAGGPTGSVSNPSSMVMARIGKARRSFNKQLPQPEKPATKEEMCPRFLELGKCKYGQACFFAHGQAELGASNAHIERGGKGSMQKGKMPRKGSGKGGGKSDLPDAQMMQQMMMPQMMMQNVIQMNMTMMQNMAEMQNMMEMMASGGMQPKGGKGGKGKYDSYTPY